ncbi:MAG: alanine--glyoxylate aminotransferase [Actinobacteria bacterium RBG_16_64_13]|nr:MAG: alanine--glyoxylate aminotransferase [Actinobacteria bacterium RBG_16_64_13]
MSEGPNASDFHDLDPAIRVLMGPGPSDVPPRVLRAMAAPTLGHLDPDFLELMTETQVLLRAVFQTQNPLTIPVSGTGSAGMEACFVNLVEPGDQVAIVVNGVFGTRMVDCAGRLGAEIIPIEVEWGRAADPQAVADALKGKQPKIVAVVHAETSTGVCQPLTEIIAIAKEHGALMMVDCVTSLGGVEVALDSWEIDAAFSGTQKCLSCPPGLAPLSFDEKAVAKMMARKTKVKSWYLDLTMVGDYWGAQRKYHHTAPINMIYALREALRLVVEEGLDARFARHRLNHEALVAGIEGMGLRMLVPAAERLASLNSVCIPAGADDLGTRRALLRQFGLEIGAGLGPLAGKIWRVGLQGHSATERNVRLFLTALESVLKSQDVEAQPGGPEAADRVYARSR